MLTLGVLIPDLGAVLIGGLAPAEALATWPEAAAYVPDYVATANYPVRKTLR